MRASHKARGSQLLAPASVMRSTAPPSRKASHVGSLSGHAARITDRRTLSWSSRVADPPVGTPWFPSSLPRSTASKGRFLIPLVVPELVQLNHPYTSTTRGRASPARRVRDRASVPVPGPGPPCPSPRPPPAEAIRASPALGAGGGWLVLGS